MRIRKILRVENENETSQRKIVSDKIVKTATKGPLSLAKPHTHTQGCVKAVTYVCRIPRTP